jgi:hypothetical protein
MLELWNDGAEELEYWNDGEGRFGYNPGDSLFGWN